MGDRGVASGPGGPPHKPEPVSTGYAQIRLTGVRLDSSSISYVAHPNVYDPNQFVPILVILVTNARLRY